MSIWRTTALRLLLLFSAIFCASVIGLMGLNYWQSTAYTEVQADASLYWQFQFFGSLPNARMIEHIDEHIQADRHHPANYYGVFSAQGVHLAGDILGMPAGLRLDAATGQWLTPEVDAQGERFLDVTRVMGAHLPDGNILVIARNAGEMTRLRNFMLGGLVWGGLVMAIAGVGLGLLVGARQIRRIQEMHRIATHIAQGHLDARMPGGRHDELDLLAQIINRMLDEIVRLMAEVKGACDGIAHDLRTPLIHVRTLLGRAQAAPASAEQPLLLEQALQASDEVLQRFAAMLKISEIESLNRRSGFAELDLAMLVERVRELYGPMAQIQGTALHCDTVPLAPIQADYPLMFEALSNIVDNAIKFTGAGGAVSIALSAGEHGPRIAVTDTGPGIVASERHAVLQRFYRSERTREVPGSGLGLSVVMAVMHLHDFTLSLPDVPHGACFVIDCWPRSLGGERR